MRQYKIRDFYFAAWLMFKGEKGVETKDAVEFALEKEKFTTLKAEYDREYRIIFRQVRRFVRLLVKKRNKATQA